MFFKTSLEIKTVKKLFYPAWSISVAYMIEKLLLFLYPPLPRTGLLFKTHGSKITFSIITYKTASYEELIYFSHLNSIYILWLRNAPTLTTFQLLISSSHF